MKNHVWVLVFAACALCWLPEGSVAGDDTVKSRTLPPIPLSLNEVLAWIDRSHPLLKGAGTEKVSARGKMLKALGAFEPVLVNDTEIERFVDKGSSNTQSVGFNDTLIEARHPSGFRGSAGFRQAIGDATIPDLSIGNGNVNRSSSAVSCPLSKGSWSTRKTLNSSARSWLILVPR